MAVESRTPGLGFSHIGDYDCEPVSERGEVALGSGIEGRSVQYHEARSRIGFEPMTAEHAHDEPRRTRQQQRHNRPPRKRTKRGKFSSRPVWAREPTAK